MKAANHVFIAVFVAALAGCATTENYEKILQTWVGEHVDALVASWGPPDSSFDLASGGKVITYEETRNVYIPGSSHSIPITHVSRNPDGSIVTSTTYLQHHTPDQNYQKSCKTSFTINGDGVVMEWNWEGNDCIADAVN